MTDNQINTIRAVVEALSSLVADNRDECTIVSNCGAYDESLVFGTREAFMNSALFCLRFILSSGKPVGEPSCPRSVAPGQEAIAMLLPAAAGMASQAIESYTNDIKMVYSEHGEVWPVVAYMCGRQLDLDEFLNELRQH
jgi:hypothetical protein